MARAGTVLIVCFVSLGWPLAGLTGCSRQRGLGGRPEVGVYPPPPSPTRVVHLGSVNDAAIFGKRSNRMSRFLFGHDGQAPRMIGKPYGLAAGAETLLVCDTKQNLVHVLDFKQQRFDTMGGSGRGRLLKPVAAAIDDRANRYVADPLRQEIVIFSPDNEPVRAIGKREDASFKPVAVAWHGGSLYVLNGALHRVEVLDPETGDVLRTFGEKGEGPGQMLFPNGLSIGPGGRAYVTDLLNCRVLVFAPDGQLVRQFGRRGDRAGEFARPKHLAVGPDGIVYVVDAGFQRVQMFDDQDRILMLFGGPGTGPGAMALPAGVCLDKTLLPHFADRVPPGFDVEYLVFVSDQLGRDKVGVYAFGQYAEDPQ